MKKHGNASHGMSHTNIYDIWCGMHRRCKSPKCAEYPLYGGRGISVCERWNNFENFYADMGERPKDHSIDRINSDGDYEPSNCRWSDRTTQNSNQRKRQRTTSKYKGVSLSSDDRWVATIRFNGKSKHLGSFDTERDAARKYDQAIKDFCLDRKTNVDLGLLKAAEQE